MLEDLLLELKDVFDAKDIKWIESCRNVSSLWTEVFTCLDFAKTAHILDRNSRQVPFMNIQAVQSLLGQTQKYSIQEVKNIDSKEFIKNFLAKLELNCVWSLWQNQLFQSEETAQDKMFISYNGPEIGESDGMLSEAF